MIVIGFDPGSASTGFGVVEASGSKLIARTFGVIRTQPSTPDPLRIKQIYDEINALILAHSPDCVASERLFFNRNTSTALTVGRTIGLILLAAAEHGLPWIDYTPLQVKQAVTGVGTADKQQVQFMVARLLNLKTSPKPDDAADALAVAICHAHSANLSSRGVRVR